MRVTTEIGSRRWYETMAFVGVLDDKYIEADVSKQVDLTDEWCITGDTCGDWDDRAEIMHETQVQHVQLHFVDLYLAAMKAKS